MLTEFVKKLKNNCISRNLSEETIRHYCSCLKLFNSWLNEHNVQDIEDVDIDLIERYLSERSKTVSKATLRHDHISIHILFKLLVKRRIVGENPMDSIDKVQIPKREPHVFTPEEINKMFMYFDKDTFFGYRNYMIISFLFSTGLRISELLAIEVRDIDLDGQYIRIIGKGDKERIVPITEALIKIVRKYIRGRQSFLADHNLKDSGYLVISRTGKRMDKNNVEDIFRKMKDEIGIEGSPHTWRHSYATFYIKNGGDVFSLQKILGHSRVETTKIYVNLNQDDVISQNNKFNPLSNKKWNI